MCFQIMARRFELDSVLQWLRETRLSTETECMSVLQGKSLSRDLQQSSTTLIKSMLTSLFISSIIRPNKKICVFWVMGLKIFGRVGTHIFYLFFFLEKNIILKGILPFKMHTIIFFPENLKKF